MSKHFHLPVQENWQDTILEYISIVVMLSIHFTDYFVHLTGLKWIFSLILYMAKPKKMLDIVEDTKDDLLFCAWFINCHRAASDKFKIITVEDLEIYIYHHNEKTYICFFTNNPFYLLDLRKISMSQGHVRRGMLHYMKLFHIIKVKLDSVKNNVVFTGYGAGGTIAAMYAWFHDTSSLVFVFGAYAMGDFKFAEHFTEDAVSKDILIHRYVSEYDIFAKFPLAPNSKASSSSFMNYDFPGSTIFINRDENIQFQGASIIPKFISYSLPRYYYFAIKNMQEFHETQTLFKTSFDHLQIDTKN
eukprot:NODE_60_length_27201_cov_1.043318.p15 type:complete len:302 gc:universal NODE_60_length_27201_cov_1.043318:10903-9998(-)